MLHKNVAKNGFAHLSIIIAVALFAIGTGTVAASDSSKPGDLLYPVDRGIENLRLSSISDDKEKAEFKAKVLGERITEAKELEKEADREEDHDSAVAAAQDNIDDLEVLLAAGILSPEELTALFERYNITELEYSVENEDGEQKVELKIKGTDEEGNEFEFESENESEELEIEDDNDLDDSDEFEDEKENDDMDDESDEEESEENGDYGDEDRENEEKDESENLEENEFENEQL